MCLGTFSGVEGNQPDFDQEIGQVLLILPFLSRCEDPLSYQRGMRFERSVEVTSNDKGVPLGNLPYYLIARAEST